MNVVETGIYDVHLWVPEGLVGTVRVVADTDKIAKRKAAVEFLKGLGPSQKLHQLKQAEYGYGHRPKGFRLQLEKRVTHTCVA